MSVAVQPGGCSSAYWVPCLLAEGVGFLRGKPRATVMVCLKTTAICLISVGVPCYFTPVLDTDSWELPWQVDTLGGYLPMSGWTSLESDNLSILGVINSFPPEELRAKQR